MANDSIYHRTIDGETIGARANAEGPIGGGAGYARIVTEGDHCVTTVEELVDALGRAVPGDTVFIPSATVLDFTEWVYADGVVLRVPEGVTVASDRGHAGSSGALLRSDAMHTLPLIEAVGDRVRISGLRLQGPDPHRRLEFHNRVFYQGDRPSEERSAHYYRLPNSTAIRTVCSGLEVDNCEIRAWSHCGVQPVAGRDHRIHHNFIHHCQRMGLGYGIAVGAAWARIDGNLFQDNKHHVAGTGAPDSGFHVHDNVVLPYTESHPHPTRLGETYGQDHIFDMHGGRDRRDDTDIAGTRIDIHHNTVYSSYQPVNIRGVPQEYARVRHNWFAHHGADCKPVISSGNTTVSCNGVGDGERFCLIDG